MTDVRPDTGRKPVLGWLSLANAGALCALIVALPSIVFARSAVAPPGGGGIGAAAGGAGSSILAIIAIDFALGLAIAIVGLVRRERPGWVHGLGVSLNLGAPGIALVILWALYH
jgi:hypothetical protein